VFIAPIQRLERVIVVAAMLIACNGCGSDQNGGAAAAPPTSGDSSPPNTADSTKINDADPAVIYSRGNDKTQDWNYIQSASEDYAQDEHSSNFVRGGGAITGVGAVINFSGTGITWIGKKGPNYGVAAYSIDGGSAKTVDNYSATSVSQNANVTISGLSAGAHVLSIALLDKKNDASSDYWQTIDAFTVEGSGLAPSQGTLSGYDSPDLKFTGTWNGGKVSDDSDLSGGHYWSDTPGSSLSWTFVGSLVEVFGRPDFEDGYMDVYIDSGPKPVATVNGHWGMADDDALNSSMLFATRLAAGQHTIKLVVTGKKDDSARNSYVQIDELIAFQ